MCHTSAGATVTNQAEHLSHISRSRVTDQVVPFCQASPGARHCSWGRLDSNQRPRDYENDSAQSSDQVNPSQLRFDLG